MSSQNKKRTTTCTECGGEAYWVDRGKDIGQFFWCPTCKKEESEWINKNKYYIPTTGHFNPSDSESKTRPDSDFDLFAYPAPWIANPNGDSDFRLQVELDKLRLDGDYTGV